ncbi:hypothetical protein [Methylobacterium sp. A54F]
MADRAVSGGRGPQLAPWIAAVVQPWVGAVATASRDNTALALVEAMRAARVLRQRVVLTPALHRAVLDASTATDDLVRGLASDRADAGALRSAALGGLAVLITLLRTAQVADAGEFRQAC